MMKAASSDKLRAGLQEHLKQTEEHVNRLEKILSNHAHTTRGKRCKGMEGVIAEGRLLFSGVLLSCYIDTKIGRSFAAL